jgi:CheY-like chemotaxis protein
MHTPQPVLIVDDEKDIRDLLRFALIADGYEVMTATNGVEAMESIHQSAPGAILLDLMMPRMSGYDVLDALRERGWLAQMPVVIMTARNLDETDHERLEGVRAIYQKGQTDVTELVKAVRSVASSSVA